MKVKVKVAQSCGTLCDPMDYAVLEILQARTLEWVPFPSPGHLPPQGPNPGLPHCRRILYQLSHQRCPWSLVPATSPILTLLKALMHRVGDVELVYFAWVSLWLTLSVSLRICSRLIFSTKPSLTCLFKTVSPSSLYAQPSSTLNFSLLNLLPYDKIYVLCGCHQSRIFFWLLLYPST